MTTKKMHGAMIASTLAAAALLAAPPGLATPLNIDEASYPGAGGDYNNLLNPPTPVVFTLPGGVNLFAGTFGTPGDGGDTLAIQLDAGYTLNSISISFATNAGMFNPVAINQGSHLVFDLASSNQPTPLVDLAITGRPDHAVSFASGPLALGAGIYNLTLLTEVLALNDNGKVGYQIALDVTAPPVPEPASWTLMLAGAAGLLAWRRRGA